MKMCNRCGVNPRYQQDNPRRAKCRKCMYADQVLMRNKRRLWIHAEKQKTGCVRCGYNEHPAALDFHHVRGEKLFNIGYNAWRGYEILKVEMAKCDVLCANCHRIQTFDDIQEKRK